MFDLSQVREHLQALQSRDEATRWEAVRALKRLDCPEWSAAPADVAHSLVETLRQLLPKRSEGVRSSPLFRQEAATVLGLIGPAAKAAVPQLMELLDEGEAHGVREAAATALGKIGKDAAPAVEPLLAILQTDCRATLALRVARALGDIGVADKRVQAALTRLWAITITCPASRVQVALALCKLRCDAPGLQASLTAALTASTDVALRTTAAEALTWCSKKEPGVVPGLAVALCDADEGVRNVAQAGLARMRLSHATALRQCAEQLKDCPHAETALRRAGPPAVPALIDAMGHAEPAVREKAARALGAIGEGAKAAAAALTKALRDRCPEVRLSAGKALWNITKEPDAVVPALAELLKGKPTLTECDGESRRQFVQSVIEALGRIGPPAQAALPTLLGKTKDENRLIRDSALRSMRQIDPAVATKTGA